MYEHVQKNAVGNVRIDARRMHERSSSRKTAAAQKKFTRKEVANSPALIKKEYGKNTPSPQLYIITAFSLSSILSAKKPGIVSFQGKNK